MADFFEVDHDSEDFEGSKEKLIRAAMSGRIIFDSEKEMVKIILLSPIKLENGEDVTFLEIYEPTANDLKITDKYKAGEDMKKSIALASRLTKLPESIIGRMKTRDLMVVISTTQLFF